LLLLVGGEGLGVAELGDGDGFEGGVVLEAGGVVVDEGGEMGVGGAADEEEEGFHFSFFFWEP